MQLQQIKNSHMDSNSNKTKSDEQIIEERNRKTSGMSETPKHLKLSQKEQKLTKGQCDQLKQQQEGEQQIVKAFPEDYCQQTKQEQDKQISFRNNKMKPLQQNKDSREDAPSQILKEMKFDYEAWKRDVEVSVQRKYKTIIFAGIILFSIFGIIGMIKLDQMQSQISQINRNLQIKKMDDLATKNQLQTYLKITNQMLFSLEESVTLGKNETISDKRQAMANKKNIEYLSGLKNLKMKYLYLWNNKLQVKDIESIFKAPWFSQLKALQIDRNDLTNQIVDRLIEQKHRNLVWLNIADNKITEQGISKLIDNAHMLPNLKYINYLSPAIKDVYKMHLKMKQMLPNVVFHKE